MSNKKRKFALLFRFLVSFGVLAWLLTARTSLGDVWRTLLTAAPLWLALSFSLHTLGLLISAVRWRILIRAQGDDADLGFLMRSYLVGTFFNIFLPSRIGGDLVRIWDGSRVSRTVTRSSAIVLVERLTGVVMLLLFALGASLLRIDMARRLPVIWVALITAAAGLAVLLSALLPAAGRLLARGPERGLAGRLKAKIIEVRETILDYRNAPRALALAFFWAFLLQINVVIHFYLIGKALGLAIGPLDYFIFIPIVLLIQLIPVTINGLGLREGAYTEIFGFYGIGASSALAFSMIDLAFMILVGLAGMIIYFTRRRSPQ